MTDPAFPTSRVNAESAGSCGMALRDYFAARAMAAMIAWDVHNDLGQGDIAKLAYEHADAMLWARTRNQLE